MINLLKGFDQINNGYRYTLFIAQEDRHVFDLPEEKFDFVLIDNFFNKPSVNIFWQQTHLPFLIKKHQVDIMFMPAANRRLTWDTHVPTVGTIHDLCQFHIDNKYDGFRMLYVKKVLPLLARRLTKIITPSQSSKDDVIKYYGINEKMISVVYNGINHQKFFPREKADARATVHEKYNIEDNYILYLSRLEHPGKNHIKLIEAYNKLKKNGRIKQKLVLVGAPWNGSEAIYDKVNELSLTQDVIFPGFVAAEDLPLFVSGTDLFIYPSLYEGFGIPVIEAMASGVPVACSNVSSLPEIVGNGALLFNPESIDDIADKIAAILSSPEIKTDLINKAIIQARKFDWKLAAEQTLALLEKAAGK